MEKPYADLHVHSYYSDGSMSPEELVDEAASNGVGILAVTDHDTAEGSIQARRLCEERSIRYIPAVEIDTLDSDTNFHVLAYGVDFQSTLFAEFLRHARFLLDEFSVKLVEAMQGEYRGFSLRDYTDFTYDKRLGGWKMLHYLMAKGLTSSLREGIPFYPRYGMTHDRSGYSTIHAAAFRIRQAGGYSVLAHPGEQIDSSDIRQFKNELRRIVTYGVNGVECYYPTHSEAVTRACLDICAEYDLIITAGSDCHGSFGKTRVGEMKIERSKLRLKALAE